MEVFPGFVNESRIYYAGGNEMTNEELQRLVEQISLTAFHRLFNHQATFNSRLRTAGGRYLLTTHNIEINPRMVTVGQSALAGIIKHELCHYHLHLTGKGYMHRDHDFKSLLAQVGGWRYAPAQERAPKYVYVCCRCGAQILRQRRMNPQRYVCARCGGRISLAAKKR